MNLTNLLTQAVGEYMLNNPCCTMADAIEVQIPSSRRMSSEEFSDMFLENDCNLYHEVVFYICNSFLKTMGLEDNDALDQVAYECSCGLYST